MGLRTWSRLSLATFLAVGCGGNVMNLGETAGDAGLGGYPTGGGTGGTLVNAGGSGDSSTTTGGGSGGNVIGPGGTGGSVIGAGGTGGTVIGAGGTGGTVIPPGPPERCPELPVSTPLALTGIQFDRTVRDLLGDVPPVPHRFVGESTESGFRSFPANGTRSVVAQEFAQAAGEVADRALARLDDLWTCPYADDERTCAVQFLLDFAERAFRRPLTPAQRDDVKTAFETQSVYPRMATRNVIAKVLSDPAFYIFFSGAPGTSGPLDGYAMASRLAYYLSRTMPDAELLAAAAAGELATVEQVRMQASRLMSLPSSRIDAMGDFITEWLELDRLDRAAVPVDPQNLALKAEDMKTETVMFGRAILGWNTRWQSLLSWPWTYVNEPLARFYGIERVTGPEFREAPVDSRRRFGILTQASVLWSRWGTADSRPVQRGLLVREKLLCADVPPPPDQVDTTLPDIDSGGAYTTRQRMEIHVTSPMCKSCHNLLDPIGFGFEHYNGLGQFRTADNGLPIDATGAINTTSRGNVPFDGMPGLITELGLLSDVPDCLATQFLRFALQRREQEGDACSLRAVQATMRSSTLDAAFIAIATSETFRHARW